MLLKNALNLPNYICYSAPKMSFQKFLRVPESCQVSNKVDDTLSYLQDVGLSIRGLVQENNTVCRS